MKRLIYILPLLLLSCSRIEEQDQMEPDDLLDIELEDNQILCGIPSTKTALDSDLNVVWSEDDVVLVICEEATHTYRFASFPLENDMKTAIFENTEGLAIEGDKCAFYPASAFSSVDFNSKTAYLSLGGITSISMPYGDAATILSEDTDISSLPLVAPQSGDILTFANLLGGLMFRPYDYAGTGVKIAKITVSSNDGRAIAGTAAVNYISGKVNSFTGTETTLTYTCPATDISKSGSGFIFYLPAGEYPQGLNITAIDNLGRKFSLSTEAITVNAGKIKKLPEIPLSIYYGSANCIMVEPGTTSVSIDVTPRYTWRGDYDITDGKPIRVENGNLSHYGKDARIVWQQQENSTATDLTGTNTDGSIISETPTVAFNDTKGTATLTVPLTGTPGNAVVSICYGNTVAWSYHIWVSDSEDVVLGDRTFLDRNLGAVSTTAGDRDAYGLCYQWGRKDPFPRILDDNETVASYKSAGDLLKTVNKSVGGTIAYTVRHPDTRITSTKTITCQNGDHWFSSERNVALWGCSKVFGNSKDAKAMGYTTKTIYDPCPKGYKVPTYGDLTTAITGTQGSTTKGRTIDGNYFPFSGFIRLEESFVSTGQTGWMIDTRGYLWSSVCRDGSGNEQGAYIMKYNKDRFDNNNSSATDPNGTGRGDQIFGFMCDAYPVRCVKENTSGTGSDSEEITPPVLEEGEVLLNTVFDMNTRPAEINSHAGLEKYSVLQPMHNNILKLKNSVLTAGVPSEQSVAHYPRIKRLKDGGVVLFYQGGNQSSRIFTMNAGSFNGLSNASPQMILSPYVDKELTAANGNKTVYQRYMNMDAVVMPDGEIIAAVQHHAWDQKEVGYYKNQGTAIELMRSSDSGKTWSKPVEVYSGASWEPYLLLLPDGRLQLYFTDSNPFLYSSQTSVMTSSDRGVTWSEKQVVCRQYKYPYDGGNTEYTGQNVYTDQMPCFRLLNDGKTLVGFLEGRHEKENSLAGAYTSYHLMSLIKQNGMEWTSITGDSQNALPSTRETSVMTGTGGYVETFPSGETVISCSSNGPFLIKLLDKDCTVSSSFFNNTWDPEKWFKPFGNTGVWGSMERYNDNILMATCSDGSEGLDVGMFYLNQQQATTTQAIMVDGDNEEWTTDKALFLSSPGGTELILRFAHDADNLYVLAESCHTGDNEDISISLNKGYGTTVKLSLSSYGELSAPNAVAVVRKGKAYDSRKGYCMEAGIPLSTLGVSSGSVVRINATVGDTAFTSSTSSTSTWQRISIK